MSEREHIAGQAAAAAAAAGRPGRLHLVHGGRAGGEAEGRERRLPVLLGVEDGAGARRVHLGPEARLRHVYVSGAPGTGKSSLLLNLVRHDAAAGSGCCVLDPHGGLIDAVLAAWRGDPERLIVVDAAGAEFPVGIDLLNARSEYEQDLVVQFFLDLFSRMYLAEHQGPMLAQAVRNGLLLLMATRRTLAEFTLVFTDKDYLRARLSECADPFVRRFFERVWLKSSESHRGESLAYFTSKFSPFFEDRLMRNILAQRGGLDFDAVIADGKVLLVDLARGRIGDTNSRLLGQVILHLVRRSAMRRDPSSDPPLFSVLVDEAHELAGGELREMVTAMRKFGVGMVLANQSLEDFAPWVRDTILGSVGTFVVLRQGLKPQPGIGSVIQPRFDRGDLLRLPDHTAILWTSAAGRCTPPARIRLAPPPARADRAAAADMRRRCAALHGRPRAEVEAELLRAVEGGAADDAVADSQANDAGDQ
jgi:hypothetical protein